MTPLMVVRSTEFDPVRLSTVIDAIETRRRAWDFSRIDHHAWGTISVSRRVLPDLDPFEVSPAVEIGVRHDEPYSEAAGSLVDLLGAHSPESRDLFLLFDLVESESPPPGREADSDTWLTTGWRDGAWQCGLILGGASVGHDDLTYRCRLFERAVRAMGLSDYVAVSMEEELHLRATPESGLTVRLNDAGLRGENPRAFDIRGLTDLKQAKVAADGVLNLVARQVRTVSLRGRFSVDVYEAVRPRLSAARADWTCDFFGRVRSPIDELFRRGTPHPTSLRVPCCEWRENEFATFYQIDVKREEEGVCLEITSNCGSVAHLLRSASDATGLEFVACAPDVT